MNLTNFFNGFRLVRSSLTRWFSILRGDCSYPRSEQFWLLLQGKEFDWQQYIEATIDEVVRTQILDFQKVLVDSGLEVKSGNILAQVHWKEYNPQGLCWDAEKEAWTIQVFSSPENLDIPVLEQVG